MAIGTWSPDGKLGAVALKAAGLITEDTMGTAVYFGKGKFRIVTDITVLEIASDDELYFIDIEANTRDATTTWLRVGHLFAGGAKEVTGRTGDDVVDEHEIIIDNPYDYQIRYHIWVVGSVTTGINFTVDAYRLLDLH